MWGKWTNDIGNGKLWAYSQMLVQAEGLYWNEYFTLCIVYHLYFCTVYICISLLYIFPCHVVSESPRDRFIMTVHKSWLTHSVGNNQLWPSGQMTLVGPHRGWWPHLLSFGYTIQSLSTKAPSFIVFASFLVWTRANKPPIWNIKGLKGYFKCSR